MNHELSPAFVTHAAGVLAAGLSGSEIVRVTAAYAVASAQYRMGLGPVETFAGGPARAGIRHG